MQKGAFEKGQQKERSWEMTKKTAGVIAALAFIALLRPCANVLTYVDVLWFRLFRNMESPFIRLLRPIYETYGANAASWVSVALGWIAAGIPAVLIYRYLVRRDMKQVCDDCAAHKVLAWTFFALFALFSITSCSRMAYPVSLAEESIPLDEAMERNGPVSLEFCLCHPDNDNLVKDLCNGGKPTEELLEAAPKIEGYRLLPIMDGNGKDIHDACYVSDKVELSESDVAGASAHKSYINGDNFEVQGELTEAGARKMRALTRDYKPGGAKNPDGPGRRLAIIVNGRLLSAPSIQSEIGGKFVITDGKFSKEDAVSLAAALNSLHGSAPESR